MGTAMIKEEITFKNKQDIFLSGRLNYSDPNSSEGVIFCHGLFSSKDAYKINSIASSISDAGFILLTFNFSYIETNKIDSISISSSVEDLSSAVEFLTKRGITKIHLIGSSMGGVTASIYSSHANTIQSLISIATPIDLRSLIIDNTKINNPENLPIDGISKIDGITIKNTFIHEAISLKPIKVIENIKSPTLLIHGEDDNVVNLQNIQLFEDNLTVPFKTEIIARGDHNLTRTEDIAFLKKRITHWLRGEYKN